MPERAFQFRPPDRRRIWQELALTMSQAAALTGVSERQIQHWMSRGYISPTSDGKRKINGESLDKIVLIGQARAAGVPLRRAVNMARDFLAHESAGAVGSEVAPAVLRDLQDRLQTARTDVDFVRQRLEDLDASTERTLTTTG